MPQPDKIRRAVYLGAAAIVLWPILMLSLSWPLAASSASFIVCAAILLFFLVISRWDIVGYWLQYIFLLALLILARHIGEWLALAFSLGFLLAIELFFRQSGRSAPLELSFPLSAGTY